MTHSSSFTTHFYSPCPHLWPVPSCCLIRFSFTSLMTSVIPTSLSLPPNISLSFPTNAQAVVSLSFHTDYRASLCAFIAGYWKKKVLGQGLSRFFFCFSAFPSGCCLSGDFLFHSRVIRVTTRLCFASAVYPCLGACLSVSVSQSVCVRQGIFACRSEL